MKINKFKSSTTTFAKKFELEFLLIIERVYILSCNFVGANVRVALVSNIT